MRGWFGKFKQAKAFIVVLFYASFSIVACSLNTQTPTPAPSFSYLVEVRAQDSGEKIPEAEVTIQVSGKAPLDAITDSKGVARIFIDSSYVGQPGLLIIETKEGYENYRQNIDLIQDILPDIIRLEAKVSSLIPTATPTGTPTVPPAVIVPENPSPEITGFTLIPSGPVLINTIIRIQVNVKRNGHSIDNFRWNVDEGIVVSGHGSSIITYQAPREPGFYAVHVELDYEGGSEPIEGTKIVEVKKTPKITAMIQDPSGPIYIGDEVTIRVEADPGNYEIKGYVWTVNGEVIENGPKASIVYQAPNEPDEYEIGVKLIYDGNDQIISSTEVSVIPKAVVTANPLNLRSGPGTNYNVIGSLSYGEILDVQGHVTSGNDEWIQVVSVNRDGVRGWVAGGDPFTEVNIDLNTVPIVTPPPPPPPTPTPTNTSPTTVYATPIPTSPDDGQGAFGTFPPLTWDWNDELGEDEYFEVRVWHESVKTYRPALGWVKKPPVFDYNLKGEKNGIYYWSVVIVRDENVRFKDWYRSDAWPYPVWEHNPDIKEETWQYLSQESEIRSFNFTPSGGGSGGPGSPVSNPPSCDEPPC